MSLNGKAHECVVMVSVIGVYHVIEHVTCAAVAAFLAAITTKNMSPLWAARRLLQRAGEEATVRIDWIFPGEECEVGAKLVKVGGEIRLEGGGLGYDDVRGSAPAGKAGEVSGAIGATVTVLVEYGPKHLLRWIAEASDGPEKVGETGPAKPVPREPCKGECHNGEMEFGGGVETKVPTWS